ncbi:MAG: hypothetical protein IM516_04860 [Pseudanabaena sp. M158S2SP1A06QC]|jgi:hypothetical protein|nr:hypothetical protein [Pseudanabaena sp. M158S2SP1A06QC]
MILTSKFYLFPNKSETLLGEYLGLGIKDFFVDFRTYAEVAQSLTPPDPTTKERGVILVPLSLGEKSQG